MKKFTLLFYICFLFVSFYHVAHAESLVVTDFDYETRIATWEPGSNSCYDYFSMVIGTNRGAGDFTQGYCYSNYQAIFPTFSDPIPNDYAIISLVYYCPEGECLINSQPFPVFDEQVTPTPEPTMTPTAIPTLTNTPTPSTSPYTVKASILFPWNNLKVKDNTNLTILAHTVSSLSMKKVEFFVNSKLICTDKTFLYTCKWKIPKGKGVSYKIFVKAYDSVGNSGISNPVIVISK